MLLYIYCFSKSINITRGITYEYNERMNSTSLLVLTALITAMGTIATMFFKVPVGTGYIHLGDTMVLLAAMLLPRKHAIFAGSVGLCLADILSGYAVWAPWSFFIKLVMVVIMQKALATAMEKSDNNRHILGVPVPEMIGFVVAAVWTVAGYYIAEGIIYGNWTAPMLGVPFNALQVAVGAVLAVLISQMLGRTGFAASFSYHRK